MAEDVKVQVPEEDDSWKVWKRFPRPQSMDRDDLLEALDTDNPLDYTEEERDKLYDWWITIDEEVRDDAALSQPYDVMRLECVIYDDIKGVYRRVIRRNAEYRHLQREIKSLQKANEDLRNTIRLMAIHRQVEKGAVEDDA